MDQPNNTVGRQNTGGPDNDIPEQFQQSQALDQGTEQVLRPSETARPHAQDADHLRPFVNRHTAAPDQADQTTRPDAGRNSAGPVAPEKTPGTGPRTGLGRGQ